MVSFCCFFFVLLVCYVLCFSFLFIIGSGCDWLGAL